MITPEAFEPLPFHVLLRIALTGSAISAALITGAGFVLGVAYGNPSLGLVGGALLGGCFAVAATVALMVAAVLDARLRQEAP